MLFDDFKMKMWAGGCARGAGLTNDLTLFDFLTTFYFNF
jgi:hypothetical protein